MEEDRVAYPLFWIELFSKTIKISGRKARVLFGLAGLLEY